MLKLLIADDERIIRETIFKIIDWKKYDIEVIGLCKNGIEAYDMILDESPDIVLTDIRMPGMSGLDLIREVHQTGIPIQFIILSGYGEFEYAKEAMHYGVKQYLLKPCNETQILECVLECKKDHDRMMRERTMLQKQFTLYDGMLHNVISSVINDCLNEKQSLDEIVLHYEQYVDFHTTGYHLFYVYYLEFDSLPEFLQQLKVYVEKEMSQVIFYGIYVKNTFLLFLQNSSGFCENIHNFLKNVHLSGQKVSLEIQDTNYPSLKNLLADNTDRIMRFPMIHYINHFHVTAICNYDRVIFQIQQLYQQLRGGDSEKSDQVAEILRGIDNIDFLKQLVSSLFLKMSSNSQMLSPVGLAEWLTQMENEENLNSLKDMVVNKFMELSSIRETKASISPMISQIYSYVDTHLEDSSLTLKQIAENYLFMNVDYVSKKFYKETGQKFSQYLTAMRITRAKQLIAQNPEEPVKNIAEQVGCGNNPQYFSQLFKKQTGITPTDYIASLGH